MKDGGVLRPQDLEGVDELVGGPPALGERWSPEGLELLLQPADTAADDQATPRQDIDGGQHFGGEHGLTLRHHHHRGEELQPLRASGKEGQRRQLVEALADAGGGPLVVLAVGILRGDPARHDHMIIHTDEAEAETLGGFGNRTISFSRTALPARRRSHAEVHGITLLSRL